MSGVANPVVTEAQLDTPLSYEAMTAIGSGLGAAGFIVFDDETDFVAVAAGVSRFLAVESCGQCTPCKQDGLAIAGLLDRTARSDAHELDLLAVDEHLQTVADGARCFLAQQQQRVIGSLLAAYPDVFRAHVDAVAPPVEPTPIAAITALRDQRAELDETQQHKQPDWTFDAVDSGKTPVERLGSPAADAVR
jgi:NADH:ubiquinone oxidoreductase subunit F (NADH-binding)